MLNLTLCIGQVGHELDQQSQDQEVREREREIYTYTITFMEMEFKFTQNNSSYFNWFYI